MAGSVTKKVPSKPLRGFVAGEINVAKDGATVKLWTVLGGKVYELAMVAQASAPASGGSGGTTDHGNLSGLSDDDHTQYVLNTGDTITGAVVVDGSADAIQLRVQGHSTQTSSLLVLEDSAGNDQVTVSNDGAVVINEEGNAVNCRIESDGDANCWVVDGTNNTVQVGAATASDSAKFYVNGKISASGELEVNGAFTVAVSTTAINLTLDATHHVVIVSATVTITLPTAVGISGRVYHIKNIGAAITVTIATTSSQTIDGSTTQTIAIQYDSISVVSDGSNWHII